MYQNSSSYAHTTLKVNMKPNEFFKMTAVADTKEISIILSLNRVFKFPIMNKSRQESNRNKPSRL